MTAPSPRGARGTGSGGPPTRAGGLRGAVAFLTAIGGAATPGPAALWWFAPVGWGVGALVGACWWGTTRVVAPGVAAAVVIAVDLALTGLLHVDGLADTGDGLLPPLPRERRLAVMRQPDVGAFGMAVVVVVLLTRWSALAAIGALGGRASVRSAATVAGLWALGRAVMVAGMVALPYARAAQGGLASAFGAGGRRRLAGAVGLGVAGVALGATGRDAALAGAGGLLGGAMVLVLARRRVGGYTGDVLGAAGMVAETVGLVTLAALLT